MFRLEERSRLHSDHPFLQQAAASLCALVGDYEIGSTEIEGIEDVRGRLDASFVFSPFS